MRVCLNIVTALSDAPQLIVGRQLGHFDQADPGLRRWSNSGSGSGRTPGGRRSGGLVAIPRRLSENGSGREGAQVSLAGAKARFDVPRAKATTRMRTEHLRN